MAENKKSFIAYVDWKETFDVLPDELAGKLIKHLFAYVNDESPSTEDVLINAVFANIKHTLKRDLRKYETIRKKRADAGRVSGEARKRKRTKRTNVQSVEQTRTKRTDSVNVNDNDINKERGIIPPTIEMVERYCKDRNSNIDAKTFFDWNTAKGWIIGNGKMKDWQAAVRTWEQRQKKDEPAATVWNIKTGKII